MTAGQRGWPGRGCAAANSPSPADAPRRGRSSRSSLATDPQRQRIGGRGSPRRARRRAPPTGGVRRRRSRQAIDAHDRRPAAIDISVTSEQQRHLSLNSTATSTMTSTGAPCRWAGEKRHCRTAWTARSFEAAGEALQNPDVADRSVAPHDDFEHDVAGDAALPCVLGVVGLHLAKQAGRLDPAAGPIRSAAGAAAGARADAAAVARAEAGAGAGSGAAASARSMALGLDRRLVRARRRGSAYRPAR